MDIETGILQAILRSDRTVYLTVVQQGLEADLFLDDKRKDIWEWVTEYSREYGSLPPAQEAARKFPSLFEDDETPADAEYYLQELKKRRLHFRLKDAIVEVGKVLKEKDPVAGLRLVEAVVAQAQGDVRTSMDQDITRTPEARYEEYQRVKSLGGMTGLPTPWPTLSRWTLGFRPGDLVVISARPGTGKSWLLTLLADEVHITSKKVPLIVSREMATEQFTRRIDAARAKIPYAGLRGGDLSAEQEERFLTMLREYADTPNFWVSSDDAAMGVTGLSAKVDQFQPDILFVDGLYLMRDDKGETGWEGITNLTRDLKRLAVRKQIPVVVTTQLNRKAKGLKASLDNLALSDSIGQDADLILGLLQTDDMRNNLELMVRLLKQREGLTGEFKIRWDLALMNFGELGGEAKDEDAPPPEEDFDGEAILFD
jgi:replicative DNA helicase